MPQTPSTASSNKTAAQTYADELSQLGASASASGSKRSPDADYAAELKGLGVDIAPPQGADLLSSGHTPAPPSGLGAVLNDVGVFLEHQPIHPIAMTRAAVDFIGRDLPESIQAGRMPQAITAILRKQAEPFQRMQTSFDRASNPQTPEDRPVLTRAANAIEGLGHGVNYLIPAIGPQIDQTQEDYRQGRTTGDEFAAGLSGDILNFFPGQVLSKMGQATRALAVRQWMKAATKGAPAAAEGSALDAMGGPTKDMAREILIKKLGEAKPGNTRALAPVASHDVRSATSGISPAFTTPTPPTGTLTPSEFVPPEPPAPPPAPPAPPRAVAPRPSTTGTAWSATTPTPTTGRLTMTEPPLAGLSAERIAELTERAERAASMGENASAADRSAADLLRAMKENSRGSTSGTPTAPPSAPGRVESMHRIDQEVENQAPAPQPAPPPGGTSGQRRPKTEAELGRPLSAFEKAMRAKAPPEPAPPPGPVSFEPPPPHPPIDLAGQLQASLEAQMRERGGTPPVAAPPAPLTADEAIAHVQQTTDAGIAELKRRQDALRAGTSPAPAAPPAAAAPAPPPAAAAPPVAAPPAAAPPRSAAPGPQAWPSEAPPPLRDRAIQELHAQLVDRALGRVPGGTTPTTTRAMLPKGGPNALTVAQAAVSRSPSAIMKLVLPDISVMSPATRAKLAQTFFSASLNVPGYVRQAIIAALLSKPAVAPLPAHK